MSKVAKRAPANCSAFEYWQGPGAGRGCNPFRTIVKAVQIRHSSQNETAACRAQLCRWWSANITYMKPMIKSNSDRESIAWRRSLRLVITKMRAKKPSPAYVTAMVLLNLLTAMVIVEALLDDAVGPTLSSPVLVFAGIRGVLLLLPERTVRVARPAKRRDRSACPETTLFGKPNKNNVQRRSVGPLPC